jgi:hypothetical protein
MPRTPRKLVLVPLVAAALSVAGCASAIPGTAAPVGAAGAAGTSDSPGTGGSGGAATSTDDPVAWVDQLCGALIPLTEATKNTPQVSGSDPEKYIDSLSQTFDALGKAAGTSLDDLNKIGPSPTPSGDKVVAQLKTTLTAVQTTATDAKKGLDKVNLNDPSSLGQLEDTLTNSDLAKLPDPTKDIASDPELDAAAKQAPNCKKIDLTG